MANLGKNIRYLRRNKNLSQSDLAEMLGYKSFTTIQKWESGASEPPFKMAKQIADIFNINMDALMNGDFENGTEIAEHKITKDSYYLELYHELDRERKDKINSFIEFLHSEMTVKGKNVSAS